MYLVSACLLGAPCRYNGETKPDAAVMAFLKDKNYIAVCPEWAGGLLIPRPASEIKGGDGHDVLCGNARVINAQGADVTDAFIQGAEEILAVALENGIEAVILKERSPSCGSQKIYDGSFSKVLHPGMGVTSALLTKAGIHIYSEENLPKTVDE